eukprot:COSAG06_NODE_1852_length_8164_cov_4.582275_4_plen_188_part_00
MSRAVVGISTARGRTGEQLHLILTLSGHGTYKARQGKARQGQARPVKARPGQARQGKARQGKARQGKARQGKARLYNVRAHSIAEKELLCNHFTEVERNVAVPRVRASVFVLCMGGCMGVCVWGGGCLLYRRGTESATFEVDFREGAVAPFFNFPRIFVWPERGSARFIHSSMCVYPERGLAKRLCF